MESTRRQFLPADALTVDGTEMDSLKMTMEGRAFDPQKKTELPLAENGNDLSPNGAPGENPGHCPRCKTHLKSNGRSEEFLVSNWMRTDCEVVDTHGGAFHGVARSGHYGDGYEPASATHQRHWAFG